MQKTTAMRTKPIVTVRAVHADPCAATIVPSAVPSVRTFTTPPGADNTRVPRTVSSCLLLRPAEWTGSQRYFGIPINVADTFTFSADPDTMPTSMTRNVSPSVNVVFGVDQPPSPSNVQL